MSAIRHMSKRVGQDPFFLAWALRVYAESEAMGDPELASFLGGETDGLPALRLCRRPSSASPVFREELQTIAGRFGLKIEALAEVLRRAEALESLRAAEGRGLLMAARDRQEPDEGES
ncbi:MAG: hypothetical protein RQ868_09250 [Meiothermus sp.]|uniref:hypothetical protein n=1 Tax=Meiothermus sp. TaxID=1955249 RepID=UPI0028CF88D9|nr:hypothetical protein [Meiothermus sp.]MDT7920761.1 hypothetical protein [Meiothermus sp.]